MNRDFWQPFFPFSHKNVNLQHKNENIIELKLNRVRTWTGTRELMKYKCSKNVEKIIIDSCNDEKSL